MAEDIRPDDPGDSGLSNVHAALKLECAQQARNALYTSTTFFIWLRLLKWFRGGLWISAAIASTAAASTVLTKQPGLEILIAMLALLGVILPGIVKAMKLDETIEAYEAAAAAFKKAEGDLRRAAEGWGHKPYEEFEPEARAALVALEDARKPSLTPPEWCFRRAQRKVQSGDYDPDP